MAHVITHRCISEVYAACQQVCPADAMHFVAQVPAGYAGAGQPMMVINSNECIDCGACKPECPIGAIVSSQDSDSDGRFTDSVVQYWSQVNTNLGEPFRGQKAPVRNTAEAPRRADNKKG